LLVSEKVLANVAVRDDFGGPDEGGIAARVVQVVVSVQQVLDR